MKNLNGLQLVKVWMNAFDNNIVSAVQFSNWLENQTDDIGTRNKTGYIYYIFDDFIVAWCGDNFRILPVQHEG